MGWLWSSAPPREEGEKQIDSDPPTPISPSSKPQPSSANTWGLSVSQRQRIFGKSSVLQANDEARDKAADADLEAFLSSLSPTDQQTTTSESPTTTTPAHLDRMLPDGSLNIHPSALYPRTMSCRQAFDSAFYCQSLGGKFNDIYRFGSLQSCSEHWGAFWFCMRTKSLPKAEKEAQISEYYAKREERRKQEFGSSEAVWDVREKPVVQAFGRDPDALDEEGVDGVVRERQAGRMP